MGKRFCRFKKKMEKSYQYYWQLVLLHFPITGDKKENTTNHKWRPLRLKERKKYADPGTDAQGRVDGWVHAGWLGGASLCEGANIVGSPSLELLRLSPYFLVFISYLDENFSSFQGCRTNRFMTTRFTMYVVDVMFMWHFWPSLFPHWEIRGTLP